MPEICQIFGPMPDRNFGCQTTFQDARTIENWHPGCQPGNTAYRERADGEF